MRWSLEGRKIESLKLFRARAAGGLVGTVKGG